MQKEQLKEKLVSRNLNHGGYHFRQSVREMLMGAQKNRELQTTRLAVP
jgi:hypothetical protein